MHALTAAKPKIRHSRIAMGATLPDISSAEYSRSGLTRAEVIALLRVAVRTRGTGNARTLPRPIARAIGAFHLIQAKHADSYTPNPVARSATATICEGADTVYPLSDAVYHAFQSKSVIQVSDQATCDSMCRSAQRAPDSRAGRDATLKGCVPVRLARTCLVSPVGRSRPAPALTSTRGVHRTGRRYLSSQRPPGQRSVPRNAACDLTDPDKCRAAKRPPIGASETEGGYNHA